MLKFNEEYIKIITESKLSLSSLKPITRGTPNIEDVKNELLKLFKISSWNEFIDLQRPGQCDFISKAVCRLFPKFKMISVYTNFSKEAMKKMEPGYTYSTHFLNKLGKTYYNFGKGSNCYEGVYVLEGLGDKYDVNVTDKESAQFSKEQQEDPKAIGSTIR